MIERIESSLIHLLDEDRRGFLFVEDLLLESTRALKSYWQRCSRPGFKLLFSVKTNPNRHVLSVLSRVVDGFDVSSHHEAAIVRSVGISPSLMTWSGPAKTDRALKDIAKYGADCLHLDSFDEWKAAQNCFDHRRVKMTVRLALPDSPSKKLGFSIDEFKKLISTSEFRARGERIAGVHAYLGRDGFSPERMNRFFSEVMKFRQFDVWDDNFKFYLGPGFPAHLSQDAQLQKQWEMKLDEVVNIECGRAITQRSGFYFTKVLSVKQLGDWTAVVIDGGLQHTASHLRSPVYGQQDVDIQFFRNGEPLQKGERGAAIQGSLSIGHDTLLEGIVIPDDLRRGDGVVVNNCGAYGFTAACNQFIGPSQAGEWMLRSSGEIRDVFPPAFNPYLSVGPTI